MILCSNKLINKGREIKCNAKGPVVFKENSFCEEISFVVEYSKEGKGEDWIFQKEKIKLVKRIPERHQETHEAKQRICSRENL